MYSFQSPCSLDFRMPPHLKKKGLQFNSSFSGSQPELSTEASGGDVRLNFRLSSLFYNSFSDLNFPFMSVLSDHISCLSSPLFETLQNLE